MFTDHVKAFLKKNKTKLFVDQWLYRLRAIPYDGSCLSSSSRFSPSAASPARPRTSFPGSGISLCASCHAGPWEGQGSGMRSGSWWQRPSAAKTEQKHHTRQMFLQKTEKEAGCKGDKVHSCYFPCNPEFTVFMKMSRELGLMCLPERHH